MRIARLLATVLLLLATAVACGDDDDPLGTARVQIGDGSADVVQLVEGCASRRLVLHVAPGSPSQTT